jgi:hypothetical protein
MNSKIKHLIATVVAATAILSTLTANATPITVPNSSFESPSSPANSSANPNIISGWTFNVGRGSVYGTEPISSNFNSPGTSSGNNAAFINNDYPNVTDTITSAASLGTITPLTEYTLTLAIGNVKQSDSSLYGAPGNVSFSLLADGVVFATDTINNDTVPNGTFENFTLTYSTPASDAIIGENLEIQMAALPEQGTAYKPAFDSVTLDATLLDPPAVPEPQTWVLVLAGTFTLCWIVRRKQAVQHV